MGCSKSDISNGLALTSSTSPDVALNSSPSYVSIGQKEDFTNAAWDEFQAQSHISHHLVGSQNLKTVRPWIGRSTCASCSQASQKQVFEFLNLTPGEIYQFKVYPAYITGKKIYQAQTGSEAVQFISGETHVFNQQGYLDRPEVWTISFIPSSSSAEISIGNEQTSGTHYLYFDYFEFSKVQHYGFSKESRLIGRKDHAGDPSLGLEQNKDWDEFTAGNTNPKPEYIVGESGLNQIRPWIGHSQCSVCAPGTAKKQRMTFKNLELGQTYNLIVAPSYVAGTAYYSALITKGLATITKGQEKRFNGQTGALKPADRWTIQFVAQSSELSIDLGHGLTRGTHYMYFDYFMFGRANNIKQPISLNEFQALAQAKDTYSNQQAYSSGRYNWSLVYILNSYLDMYELTGNIYWLERLVEFSENLLAQRDSELGLRDYRGRLLPAWQERSNNNYAWMGYTAGLFGPMIRFSTLVLSHTELQNHEFATANGESLAIRYINEYQKALDIYEEDWRDDPVNPSWGYYTFPQDLPVRGADPLKGQPLAHDFSAMVGSSLISLSKSYRLLGQDRQAQHYKDRVVQMARFFQSRWDSFSTNETEFITWEFATYSRVQTSEGEKPLYDDIGHSNVNVKFIYDVYKSGLAYELSEMKKVANMTTRLVESDHFIPYNLTTGELSSSFTWSNTSTYYHSYILPFTSSQSAGSYWGSSQYRQSLIYLAPLVWAENQSL